MLKQAAADLHIKPAARIYLDPLPPVIPLDAVFAKACIKPSYHDKIWTSAKEIRRILAYWGERDIPRECMQEVLKTDFSDKDGHLFRQSLWRQTHPGQRKGSCIRFLANVSCIDVYP